MAFNRLAITGLLVALTGSAKAALTVGLPILETISFRDGGPTYGPCITPTLSESARLMSFLCQSSDIVPGDDNDRYDTFLLDRETAQLVRISIDSFGHEHRFDSNIGLPSDGQSKVAFNSYAKLDATIPWEYHGLGISNVFLRDLILGTTTIIGLNAQGETEQLGTQLAAVLYDRQEVLLSSGANLLGMDTNGALTRDLFIRNWKSGDIELISASPTGEQGNCFTENQSVVSNDGRYVAFVSCASNLTSDNQLGTRNLFLRDRWLKTTRRLSRPWNGGEFITSPTYNLDSSSGRIIANRYLAFSAIGGDFVVGSIGTQSIAYLIDINTNQIELLSHTWSEPGSPAEGRRPSMSADGRYVAFHSRSPNIQESPTSTPAVYIKDRVTGEIVNVTQSLPATSPYPPSISLSADGSTLAFSWRYDEAAPQPYTGRELIYTVSIRGTPIAPPRPEPVPSTSWMGRVAALTAFSLLGGWITLRRRRRAT